MSNQFITNQDRFLSDIINGILPKTNAVDILVGYFYFSGYSVISDRMQDKKIRILVGLDIDITVSKYIREFEDFSNTLESRHYVREGYYDKFVKLFNDTDCFDSDEKIDQFRKFFEKIQDGSLEIRKTMDPNHAKMYLFAYNGLVNENGELPGVVITGSSNLSYQGLKGRLELNARFNDKADYLEGLRIFEDLWAKSVEVAGKETIEEWKKKVIHRIWFDHLYSPYLMYIRVLKEYFDIVPKEDLMMPYDITGGRYRNLRYQTDAVQMAMTALENHNGAIIADVVGLGKSIIASTIARNLRLRSIIVCPPHLKGQWESYRDEFGFTASVFSSGLITEAIAHYDAIRKPKEQFLIIVDEAHRIRNEYTKDYANLHSLCSGNKVLLLTATPFNNRPNDIFSLLKLFQVPSRSTLKTVENLGATFRSLISQYNKMTESQRKGNINDEEINKEIESISKAIRTIINPLVIRRSRIDLQEIDEYKEDLKEQGIELVIPNDPEELTYDLGTLKSRYLNTLNRISPDTESEKINTFHYKAARYSPILYIKDELRNDLAQLLEKETNTKFNMLIGSQTNVAKFMRHLLVSRFESSVAAFRASLNNMIISAEHLVEWVKKRDMIPVYKKGNLPDVENFYDSTDDGEEEIEEAFEKYKDKGFFEIPVKYVKDDFLDDVQNDIQLLKNLRETWFGKDGKIREDPKLISFIDIVKRKLTEDPNRKLIVFSAYADTVNYLGTELQHAGLPVMKYTSADASTVNKDKIKANFDAGIRQHLQRNDYQVLVATDAISEGYNLNRAGSIVNYDIPYNPTRVIQRIGRINRVNRKMFDELYVFNYFPTDVGERETRTKEISTLKMAMIHAIMGEDTKALTSDEELQSFFKEQFQKELAKSETASWDMPYRQLLNQLKGTENYKDAELIPHRARTGRNSAKSHYGVLMFGKKGNDYVFKIGSDAEEQPMMIPAEDALSLFEAEKDEIPVSLSESFDRVYQKVKSSLFNDDVNNNVEKDTRKAYDVIKYFRDKGLLPKDYAEDLLTCLAHDALAGYEIRFIGNLKKGDVGKLRQQIPHDYLARQIDVETRVSQGEETIILSEELQSQTE